MTEPVADGYSPAVPYAASLRSRLRHRARLRLVTRAYAAATTPDSQTRWGSRGRALVLPPLRVERSDLVHLGDGVVVLEDCWMSVVQAFPDVVPSLVLCQDVRVGRGCQFSVVGSLIVRERALIGDFVQIGDTFHPPEATDRMPALTRPRAVVIGADAVIAGHAAVLPGVTVGAGAVVDHHAVVTTDVPPGTRVAGNPARPV